MTQTTPFPELEIITFFQEDLHPHAIYSLQSVRQLAFAFTNKASVQNWDPLIDEAEDMVHCAVLVDGKTVGCGRLKLTINEKSGSARFSRIAIRPNCQKQGLGKALISHIMSDVARVAKAHHISIDLSIEVREHLVEFYKTRFGFERVGFDQEYYILHKSITPLP